MYVKERDSFKPNLALSGEYVVDFFWITNLPEHTSRLDNCGLRDLAFDIDSVTICRDTLVAEGIICETIRAD